MNQERDRFVNARQVALYAYTASEEKKGVDPLILDLKGLTDICDFFVLVHGTSDRHVRTIADAVEEKLQAKRIRPSHVEGKRDGRWILLDYGSVMVHVFHYASRKFYSLERLWGEAKVVRVDGRHERKTKRTRRSRAS